MTDDRKSHLDAFNNPEARARALSIIDEFSGPAKSERKPISPIFDTPEMRAHAAAILKAHQSRPKLVADDDERSRVREWGFDFER